jgi:hypothetical protein
MMLVLTEDAGLFCKHGPGKVSIKATQALVMIEGRKALVEKDPEGRPIAGCPSTVPFKPCLTTLVVQKGYSDFIRVDGRRLCLDTVTGFTDGTPPGIVKYEVRFAGQKFVSEAG